MAKVAVVDDAPEVLDLVGSILRSENYQVVTYSSGENLEEKLAEDPPDLLLLDVVMPGRDGFGILRSLKRGEGTKSVPVVIVSSKNEESDIAWGKMQGADHYVTKPFTPDELLQAVRQFAQP